jgi:hypothetical protein
MAPASGVSHCSYTQKEFGKKITRIEVVSLHVRNETQSMQDKLSVLHDLPQGCPVLGAGTQYQIPSHKLAGPGPLHPERTALDE